MQVFAETGRSRCLLKGAKSATYPSGGRSRHAISRALDTRGLVCTNRRMESSLPDAKGRCRSPKSGLRRRRKINASTWGFAVVA